MKKVNLSRLRLTAKDVSTIASNVNTAILVPRELLITGHSAQRPSTADGGPARRKHEYERNTTKWF